MHDQRFTTILSAIEAFTSKHGFSPTIRELSSLAGMPQSTVHMRLRWLETHGYITRQPRMARSIALVKKE